MKTLKVEDMYPAGYETFADRRAVAQVHEEVCNAKRLYSACVDASRCARKILNYLST